MGITGGNEGVQSQGWLDLHDALGSFINVLSEQFIQRPRA